ncbi:MAG TPA: EAL domain-containing protein, partial [Candidatus Dormibacteraeota bacterium]|nr:EAL domain-containing protein [Candidatus Dormibacteraeota bacterium]
DEQTLAFLAVNEAAVAQYGYTAAEFLERTILDIRPPEDVADVLDDVAGRGAAERQEGVWRHVRKDGSVLQVGVSSQRTAFAGRPAVFVVASEVGGARAGGATEDGARVDPLTGLATRAAFVEAVRRAARRAGEGARHVAVVAVDIDGFRSINREAGRSGGDLTLLKVARRLEGFLAASPHRSHAGDLAGRLGPDDFVILCEDVGDALEAASVAHEVRAAVDALIPLRGRPIRPRVSIGVAVSTHGQGDGDAEAVIAEAQEAIVRARASQTARDAVAAPHLDPVARDAGIEDGLLDALVARQLHVVYQPRLSLSSGTIVGVEALARWDHPVLGRVPPAEFIPVAERTGVIVPLGVWVLEEACRAERRWHATFADRPPLVVSVNVSARQFESELSARVAALVRRTGIDPAHLCLELTESTVMADVDAAVEVLRRLKDLGVKISIDDFGTGYSSLAYLKRLPLDELKIDRSFVEGLAADADSIAIVAAIVATAHALDLTVVAEGVETLEQIDRLRELGCDEVQGFHIAKPGRPAEIDGLLAREAAVTSERRQARLVSSGAEGRHPVALIVDDAADVRALVRMSLAAAGFAVHEAASGEAALVLAREVRPDCAVLDMNLPGIDGREVARLLRRDAVTRDAAIVVVTAAGDPTDKATAFGVGVDDYIVKPFAPRDLVSRVRFAMRRRESGGEAAHG